MNTVKKLICHIIILAICFSFIGSVNSFAEVKSKWNKPEFYPKQGEHPRLMITPKDIPIIKANQEKPQNQNAYKKMRELAETEITGVLSSPKNREAGNIDVNVLAVIEAKAFDYVINANEKSGKEAISAIKNILSSAIYPSVGDYSRDMGSVIYTTSEVYDWCYPMLSDKERKEFIYECQKVASQLEIGWPMNENFGAVIGHGAESQLLKDMIGFAIATYDEAPEIYENVMGRFFDEYVPARNYWYASHSMHQGSGYNSVRYLFDLWSQWLTYKISGKRVYIDDCQYVGYQYIYYTRPDEQLIREGDYSTETLGRIPAANTYSYRIGMMASGFYKDPYLKMELARVSNQYSLFSYGFSNLSPVTFLLVNDPDLEPKAYKDLATTKYFGKPNGLMVARSGWDFGLDSPVSIAFMKIGGLWMANHNHLDHGTFQIYYKGMLANDSGIYDSYSTPHDLNWDKETISHNGLLIYDPSEFNPQGAVNSGGQRRPGGEKKTIDGYINGNYEMAEVIGHEFGPDELSPEYSYISGDITKAYTDKVSEVYRSMMYMPTDDKDAPAVFFVMDKITAKKDNFKKTFLLHSLQEPSVNGNITEIKRDTDGYNGKLTVQTLYPEDPVITKIGGEGKQWDINGINYVPRVGTAEAANKNLNYGWGRIEISPSEKQKTDYFLNVMYVSDADSKSALKEAKLIENSELIGAKIGNKVTLFNKEKKRISSSTSFLMDGEGEYDIAVCGLEKGEWTIICNGKEIDSQIASEDGGMIYFKGGSGRYSLRLKDASKVKEKQNDVMKEHENIYIKIGKRYLYTDVAPTIINGTTFVPMRAIMEAYGAIVDWDDATKSATVSRKGQVIKIAENSNIAYVNGKETKIVQPVQTINDRFMVPVRFISENFGSTVSWDEFAKIVNISEPRDDNASNAIPVINTSWSSSSTEERIGSMAVDGDIDTRWAADGIGEWLVMEFEDITQISSFSTAFSSPTSRGYSFELHASKDGKNYEKIFEGSSTQKNEIDTFKLQEPVNAKYIKYVGKGGTYTDWILLHEIEFFK